jgi:hypothetical protein
MQLSVLLLTHCASNSVIHTITVYSKYLVMRLFFFFFPAAVLGQEQAGIQCSVPIELPFMAARDQITVSRQFSLISRLLVGSMVFRHISKDIKERVLWLRGNGYITDDICNMFGVSLRSIQRWQSNLDQYGSVIPPKNPLQGLGGVGHCFAWQSTRPCVNCSSSCPNFILTELTL